MESLREAVTCPVCQEVPAEGGLLLCKASHTICEGCYSKLKERKVCPQCQVRTHGQLAQHLQEK